MNRKPSAIGLMWRALVTGPAPVRLWAQILGFGTIIGALVHTLAQFFVVIQNPTAAIDVKLVLAKGAVAIALALCFIALAEVVAITELKIGFNASREGFKADLERDNDEPIHASVEGDVKITPKPDGANA